MANKNGKLRAAKFVAGFPWDCKTITQVRKLGLSIMARRSIRTTATNYLATAVKANFYQIWRALPRLVERRRALLPAGGITHEASNELRRHIFA